MRQARKWIYLSVLTLAMVSLAIFAAACSSTDDTSTTGDETETTTVESTATTMAAEYDITAIVSGIQMDEALNAMLPEDIKTNGVRVGSDIPYQPWEMYVGDTEEITGFDFDLAQALGAVLGVDISFNQTVFDSLIPSLQADQNDIVMSAMYDNLKRRQDCDFVDYAWDGTSILVAKGNPKAITGFADLAGRTVGCERGTTQATLLENLSEQLVGEGKAAITINQYDDQPTAFTALQSGRIDCDVTDSSTAAYNAINTGAGDVFEVIIDPDNPTGLDPTIIGMAILKTNPELRDAMQQALQKLIDDGTYTTIISNYGLTPVESAEVNQGTSSGE